MRPVRAVFFDFGGVLYQTPNPLWLHRLQQLLRIQDTGLLLMTRYSTAESQVVMDIMTGKLHEDALWNDMARRWRLSPGLLARIRRSAVSPRRLNHALIRFASNLRSRVKVAILTNAGTGFRKLFVEGYGLEQLFDSIIISAEEGIAKPDSRIYTLAAQRLGVDPEEAVFVDDLIENVTGARQAGMDAFVYASNAATIGELSDRLNKLPH